jgi:hypothetical protein
MVESGRGCVPSEADMLIDRVEEKRRALREVRAVVAELYADRGEDRRTAELCNQALRIIDANA